MGLDEGHPVDGEAVVEDQLTAVVVPDKEILTVEQTRDSERWKQVSAKVGENRRGEAGNRKDLTDRGDPGPGGTSAVEGDKSEDHERQRDAFKHVEKIR
jgi:hypothetical protein